MRRSKFLDTISKHLERLGFQVQEIVNEHAFADIAVYCNDSGKKCYIAAKGRLTFYRAYLRQNLHVAFLDNGKLYLYPHDQLIEELKIAGAPYFNTVSWIKREGYSNPIVPQKYLHIMEKYHPSNLKNTWY
ncbi:MAG: hypothetical protein GDA55_06580 [Cellvibrionales bacterium]|nr:hypothetical protein [Cellvibrionales bacterium]